MERRRIKDLSGRDQPASGSRNDRENMNSGEYENASGITEEWKGNVKPDEPILGEVDLQENSPEEDDQ